MQNYKRGAQTFNYVVPANMLIVFIGCTASFFLLWKNLEQLFHYFFLCYRESRYKYQHQRLVFSMFINLFWTRKTECHNFLLHSRTSNFVSFSVKNLPLWEYKASISRKFCTANILCKHYTVNNLGPSDIHFKVYVIGNLVFNDHWSLKSNHKIEYLPNM